MEKQGTRESERIEIQIPVEVIGTDCLCVPFIDKARTEVVGRHGGKLCLGRKLAPQQEVTIRCLATGLEGEARIVGQIGESDGAYYYGIKFLDEETNIWGIGFPPDAASEGSAGRVLLECRRCKQRELKYLDALELEVLETNGSLSHSCSRCRDVSLWQHWQGESAAQGTGTAPTTDTAHLQERRKERRREICITACVRTARFGQDLVRTRNVSRSGLCFASACGYVAGEEIEVAVPYSPRGGNIFLRGRIVRRQFLASERSETYGVLYQSIAS